MAGRATSGAGSRSGWFSPRGAHPERQGTASSGRACGPRELPGRSVGLGSPGPGPRARKPLMQHCQACGGLGTQRGAGGAAGRGCRGQGTQGRSTAAGAQGGTLAVGCASGGDSVCEEPGRRCGRQAVPPRLLAWPQGGGQRGGGGPCPSSAPALQLPPHPHPSRAPPRGPSLPRPRAPASLRT